LDQTEHGAFLSVNKSLQSRTTLIAETRVGTKSYAGVSAAPAVPAAVVSQGQGRGMGPSVRQTPVVTSSATATAETECRQSSEQATKKCSS
jgi:hypothetical protein